MLRLLSFHIHQIAAQPSDMMVQAVGNALSFVWKRQDRRTWQLSIVLLSAQLLTALCLLLIPDRTCIGRA